MHETLDHSDRQVSVAVTSGDQYLQHAPRDTKDALAAGLVKGSVAIRWAVLDEVPCLAEALARVVGV